MERESHSDVFRLCEEADFPITDVREEGDVLVLVPRQLARLPGSERLRRLADRLQRFGYRHVAFAVESEE